MSRFPELIGESIERLVIAESLHVEELASAIARETLSRQGALRSQVRIEAIQSTTRTAPRSGLPSQEISTLIGVATASAAGHAPRGGRARARHHGLPVRAGDGARPRRRSAWPSMGYGEEERERILDAVPIATHNQRGEATLLLGTREHVPAERLAAIAERSMSAPILTLLKRTDELHVVEQAHANPRFVEDVVREMVAGVVEEFPELEDDAFVQAHQLNFETIHAHDVIAERTGLLGELRARARGRRRRHARVARRLAAQLGSEASVGVEALGERDDRVEHVDDLGADEVRGRQAAAGAEVRAGLAERADAVEAAGDRAAVGAEQVAEQLAVVLVGVERHDRRVDVEHALAGVVLEVDRAAVALDQPAAAVERLVDDAEPAQDALDVEVRLIGLLVAHGAAEVERLGELDAVAPLEDRGLDDAARAVGMAPRLLEPDRLLARARVEVQAREVLEQAVLGREASRSDLDGGDDALELARRQAPHPGLSAARLLECAPDIA